MANNTVRIIGGKWRGKRLSFPENTLLRPTLDAIRETLFNWLQPLITASRCLDAFTGSGALGIEALSRGAAQVTFVDNTSNTLIHLRHHLQQLNITHCHTLQLTLPKGLSQLQSPAYDIIFLDPPFHSDLLQQTLRALAASSLIKRETVIYFETTAQHELTINGAWRIRRYKKTRQICYGLLEVI